MRQWIADARSNTFLIVPRIFAVLYGALGVFFLLVFLFAVAGWVMSGIPFVMHISGITVATFVVVAYMGIIFILLSIAKGFWKCEKWVPGFVIFLHSVLIVNQISRIWRGEISSIVQTLALIVLNGLVIIVLLIPSVRRLFRY